MGFKQAWIYMYMSKTERNRISMNGKVIHENVEWERMKARCLAYILSLIINI